MITEENFLDFECPYCGQPVSFPQASAGFAQECPGCSESLIVPGDGSKAGRKLPIPITTPRLILRRLTAGDWKDLLEFMSDEELFRYTAGGPLEEEETLRWLERDSQVKLTTPDQTFCLGIEVREGGKLIGYVGLQFTDQQRLQATVHILLSRSHQRKGFALEAVNALLRFCFGGIKLHRVAARCDSRNAAACKLFANVGMRREGEFVKDQPLVEGGWANSVWYAALDEEYGEAEDAAPEESAT